MFRGKENELLGGFSPGKKEQVQSLVEADHVGVLEAFAYNGPWWRDLSKPDEVDYRQRVQISFGENSSGVENLFLQLEAENGYDASINFRQNITHIKKLGVALDFDRPLVNLSGRSRWEKVDINGTDWIVGEVGRDNKRKTNQIELLRESKYACMMIGAALDGGVYTIRFTGIKDSLVFFDIINANGDTVGAVEASSGKTYTFTEDSTGLSIKFHVYGTGRTGAPEDMRETVDVSIIAESIVLADGYRINKADSIDPKYKYWKAYFGQNSIFGGFNSDDNNRIMLHCDDVASLINHENRFVAGDYIPLPEFIGARVNIEEANNAKTAMGLEIKNISIPFSIGDGGSRDFDIDGDAIKISTLGDIYYDLKENKYDNIVPVSNRPILGSPDAPVTLVLFCDFNEPYSKQLYPTIKKLQQDLKVLNGGNEMFNVVGLPFILSGGGKNGRICAEAAELAGKYGKYWDMVEKIMEKAVGSLDAGGLVKIAGEIGIDEDEFKARLDAGETRKEVEELEKIAKKLNVNGSPTSVIGERVKGASYEWEKQDIVIGHRIVGLGQFDHLKNVIMRINSPESDRVYTSAAYYLPEQKMIAYKKVGDSYFSLGKGTVSYFGSGFELWTDPRAQLIGFREKARELADVPTQYREEYQRVISAIKYEKEGDGNYKFSGYGAPDGGDYFYYDQILKPFGPNRYEWKNNQFEQPLQSEAGSIMTGDSRDPQHEAKFYFNYGGDSRFENNIIRWNYKLQNLNSLSPYEFENPLEETDGKTKNGIERDKYPNYSIIPSPNNEKYEDSFAEYHIYSPEGTLFSFLAQQFANKAEFAYKIKPKDAWVEGESIIPIMGKEMLFVSREGTKDANGIGGKIILEDSEGVPYVFEDQNRVKKIVNGQEIVDDTDPLCSLGVRVGECSRIGGKPVGLDAIWLLYSGGVHAVAGPPTEWMEIYNSAKLALEQQERSKQIGLEIVGEKTFEIHTDDNKKMNATRQSLIELDINKIGGNLNIQPSISGPTPDNVAIPLSDIEEIYLSPFKKEHSKFADTTIEVFYKLRGNEFFNYGMSTLSLNSGELVGSLEISDGAIPKLFIRISENGEDIIFCERIGQTGDQFLMSETKIEMQSNVKSDGRINPQKIDNIATYALAEYRITGTKRGENVYARTQLESYTDAINTNKYNIIGTEVQLEDGYPLKKINFKMYDNDTYPTRWMLQEEYSQYLTGVMEPQMAQLEYTDGRTRNGIFDIIGTAIMTYPNYSMVQSTNSQMLEEGQRAEYHIYSPEGSMFDPAQQQIFNTPYLSAFHFASEKPLENEGMVQVMGRQMKILYKGTINTESVPEKEKIDPYLRNKELPALVLCDENNVYVMASWLPVMKMWDWGVLPADDERVKNDELCQYFAVVGGAKDMFDIVNERVDEKKDELWLVPNSMMEGIHAYNTGEQMQFLNGAKLTLTEMPRDKVAVELGKQEVGGVEWDVLSVRAEENSGYGDIRIRATDRLGNKIINEGEELFFKPKSGENKEITGYLIRDGKPEEIIIDPVFEVLQNGKVVGQIELDARDMDSDNILFREYLEPYFLAPADKAFAFETGSHVLETKVGNAYQYDYPDNSMHSVSESLGFSGMQYSNNKKIRFDKQESILPKYMFNGKGTKISQIGEDGNAQGFGFEFFNNANYPTRWSLEEQYAPYVEGNIMSRWAWLGSKTFIENVYPNPVSRDGVINVKVDMKTPGIVHFDIYGIEGMRYAGRIDKGALMPDEYNVPLELSPLHLTRGAYIMIMHSDNLPPLTPVEARTAKFIVE